jgi:hypothetical protein
MIGVTLIIATCLIISGVFVTELFSKQEETVKDEPIEDSQYELDKISPLTNQGLILEIKRIRHRGLLDKLIKPGGSWKEKPSFYFISNIDDLEYVSDNIQTWDTMFKESKTNKFIDEEQETSEVELIIIEHIKKGLLGLRSQEIERERIHVTYDYRTGRWSGSDFFKDTDGYGHYVGEYFEVWFNLYQNDYDGDGIPYWTEVNALHTDPKVDDSSRDPDKDDIPTAWEWKWGYNPHVWNDHINLDPDMDGIENIEEYQMVKWFADPFSQDIYVEVDGTEKGGLRDLVPHVFFEESQQGVIERFCEHNINLYIDHGWPDTPQNGGGEMLPYNEKISQDSGMILQFYEHHFPDERKGIFRYVVIGNRGGFNHPAKFNSYDAIHLYVNTKNFLRPWKRPIMMPTQRAIRVYVGQEFMHETGHSLGIVPWTIEGCDNASYSSIQSFSKYRDTWAQYNSVMNYYWLAHFDVRRTMLDYSDGSNGPPYDQNDWEHFYLPTFQTESVIVEDITATPPGYDLISYELEAVEKLEFGHNNWKYNKSLTHQYIDSIESVSPIQSIEIDWRVYEEIYDYKSTKDSRNVRVYGLPDVYPTDAEYLLMEEGYVDSEGNLQFYSIQNIIEDIMS